ncbi:MAG TPA: DUF3054 domain-containing protein [Chloroflexota bacterium]|nr:DUF3054 domain-containing protein [Chloroflexota bacterium]
MSWFRPISVIELPCLATLVAGDGLAFLLFAGLGRDQHGESGGALSVVATAAPFLVAWFVVSPRLGVFRSGWRRQGFPALRRVAVAWLVAWPIALLLRAALQRRGIPLSFDIVALLTNGVFLLTWRGLYLAWAGRRANR